jgi:hypothetical protein
MTARRVERPTRGRAPSRGAFRSKTIRT